MVEIPDEVLENPTPLWEDFIVGKFLDLAPHVAKVHMVLNKIWKYGDSAMKVDVYEENPTTMRFKVSNQKAREKILRRGMWNIAGVPMIVTKWTPSSGDDKKEDEAIPMWVHLEKVPLHMYSWEGISFFTSTVGVPVKLHPETIACTNLEVAKVFVNVDVSKTLPKEINFSKNGKQFVVKYYYPWLPARCNYCDKWGHGEAVCAVKAKGKKRTESTPVVISKSQDKKEEIDKEVETVNVCIDEEVAVAKSHEAKKGTVNEEVPKVLQEEDKCVSVKDSNAWSLVSPGKIGRLSVSSNQKEQGVLISASKFSLLSTEEEKEVDKEDGEIISEEQVLDVDETEEEELIDRSLLDQQIREEVKVGRRGRKPKALDANPVSTRTKRQKH
ncbi:uncharacterized protein LOC108835438 [Raphanus sativus]|uniref:Uncharacterized protein LOC108835438 n=1 Tax=Raphanus sativus TaxID=3726 RepID=A0A9W3DTP2_RAPSA|nr:uncharacterized protein LOC108835438 [Raphanus sativus]